MLQMDSQTVPPPGAVLVRVEINGRADLRDLPPVPAPHLVTVTFGDARLRALLPPDGLEPLGYRLVGAHDAGGIPAGEALFLVRRTLLDAQPQWAARLFALASKAYDCDLGPVQHVFGRQLAQHLLFDLG